MSQDLIHIDNNIGYVRQEVGKEILELVDLFWLTTDHNLYPLVLVQQVNLQYKVKMQ